MTKFGGTLILRLMFYALALMTIDVYAEQLVIGWKDNEVQLPCDFVGAPYALFWWKLNPSNPKDNALFARIFNGQITTFDDRFTLSEGYTLSIEDLKVIDDGLYFCHVQLDSPGEDDLEIYTHLSVYARASAPVIEQCDHRTDVSDGMQDIAFSRCVMKTSDASGLFNLDCKVTGYRPNITMVWINSSGRVLQPVGEPEQTVLEDGTFESVITISVGTKHDTDQNFTCMTEGVTAAEDYLATITLSKATGSENGLSTGATIGISITTVSFIAAVIVGIVLFVMKKSKEYQRVPTSLKERDVTIDTLRQSIKDYRPGKAANISVAGDRVTIGLFGHKSAGTMFFSNCFKSALEGQLTKLGDENVQGKTGRTKNCLYFHFTDHIDLNDNAGFVSLDEKTCRDLIAHVLGKGSKPNINCAVFVYHYQEYERESSVENIGKFFHTIYRLHGRYPLLLVRHSKDIDKEEVKEDILALAEETATKRYIPKENIWFSVNYDDETYKLDDEKDTLHLKLVWEALTLCDYNLYHAVRRSSVIHEAK